MLKALSVVVALVIGGCDNGSLGLSMLFLNRNEVNYVATLELEVDGKRGPNPGYLGPGGQGAQMSFMADDRDGGTPKTIQIRWAESTPESEALLKKLPETKDLTTPELKADYDVQLKKAYAAFSHYTHSFDLQPILTPELVKKVRKESKFKLVKLTIIFKGSAFTVTAEPDI